MVLFAVTVKVFPEVFPSRAVERGEFKHEHKFQSFFFVLDFLRLSEEFDTLEENR